MYQYAANTASAEEVEEMFVLLKSAEGDAVLKDFILNERIRVESAASPSPQKWEDMWQAIRTQTVEQKKAKKAPVSKMMWYRMAAAIAVLFASGTGIYLYLANKTTHPPQITVSSQHYNSDIPPGGNKAILTLANGSVIVLDTVQKGLLAKQGNTIIVKLANGELVYNSDKKNTGELVYNTVSTPRGGQYQMVLPDGSKVWLNAASSLRFPASFSIKERRVELSGEAYFEVASQMGHGKKVPFIVHVSSASSANGMDVEVVGTHFNIMSYADEQNIKTTLLEGKVKVSQDGITRNLEPGRQAIVDHQTHAITVANANVEQAVAWKDGQFRFKETGISELMRQVSRWYNVEVEYRTNRTDQDYTGIVSRTENVSSILKMLEATGTVHFMVEKTKIIVLP